MGEYETFLGQFLGWVGLGPYRSRRRRVSKHRPGRKPKDWKAKKKKRRLMAQASRRINWGKR